MSRPAFAIREVISAHQLNARQGVDVPLALEGDVIGLLRRGGMGDEEIEFLKCRVGIPDDLAVLAEIETAVAQFLRGGAGGPVLLHGVAGGASGAFPPGLQGGGSAAAG